MRQNYVPQRVDVVVPELSTVDTVMNDCGGEKGLDTGE